MQDSLVNVKFTFVPFATCLLPLQLLLQGFFLHQHEVKQPHRSTKKPTTMNYLVPPEAPDHLALLFAKTVQPL